MSTSRPSPSHLHFQRLDVYRLAVRFLGRCEILCAAMPAGRAYLRDQLRRAALSIVNNIAEGAGEFAPNDKARFYRMALRSCTECAATVDAGAEIGIVGEEARDEALQHAARIVSMLTRLIARMKRGTGTGTGLPGSREDR